MIDRIAAEVKTRTSGRVDIQGFPGGRMGSSRDMIEAVSNGTQQLITEGATNFGTWIPSISVTEAPYLRRNPAHLIKAMNGPLLEKYNAQLIKARGMRIVGAVYYGTRHLTTSDRAGPKLKLILGLFSNFSIMAFALIFAVKGMKLVENNLDIETVTLFFNFWLVYAIIPVTAVAGIGVLIADSIELCRGHVANKEIVL